MVGSCLENPLAGPIKTNLLRGQTSPYLRQHQNNPIWWYPWSEQAFADAKSEDKPIFLSVGYSTCHWCHVMEGDSFENPEIANLLNDSFISIKVDREERPDVDAIYMTAVQALTHRGGWPMSVFLTPDGEPFWAGTFVPRQEFVYILKSIASLWTGPDRARVLKSSQDLTSYLKRLSTGTQDEGSFTSDTEIGGGGGLVKNYFDHLAKAFEPEKGGFSDAPKFPSTLHILALFRMYHRSKDKRALAMALKTLDEMARGGIHDQIGGGFHRYSTDDQWLVPHFEKMLYDNALLLWAYTEAFQITGHTDYQRIVKSTANYLARDLQSREGGLFSAEDADSEKCEGKFYVWQENELRALLSDAEFEKIRLVYSVTAEGNFHVDTRVAELEKAAGMTEIKGGNVFFIPSDCALPSENDSVLYAANVKLFAARCKKIRPLLDDKCIAAWNGLGIAGLAKAGHCFQDSNIISSALQAGTFALRVLIDKDGRLCRHYRDGVRSGSGFLEDYAALALGFLELYQASGDVQWLNGATSLQKAQDQLFWNEESGSYFDADGKDPTIIIRTRDFSDNAIPSGNSMAAYNLLRLGNIMGSLDWLAKYHRVIRANASGLAKYPMAYPLALMSICDNGGAVTELQMRGPLIFDRAQAFWRILRKGFYPHLLISMNNDSAASGEERNLETSFRICREQSCQLETTDFSDIESAIAKTNHLIL